MKSIFAKNKLGGVNRIGYGLVAGVFLLVTTLFLLQPLASAAQLSSRSIQLSDSGPSGGSISTGIGSGTNVDYKATFTTSGASIAGIVIDFCSNSPIPGDSCTAPTSLNVNRSTLTVNNQTNLGAGAFAVYTSDATNNRVIITRASAAVASGASSFELGNGTTTGITNPSTTGTFYARIYTYATAAAAQAHNTGTPSGYIDNGGIALSTANVITITAKVFETLTFCVSGTVLSPTTTCAGATTAGLTLGHGSPTALDTTAVDTANAYTQLSTNAQSGASVRMHNSNACGALSSNGGTTCSIPAVAAGAGTPAGITAGTAAFGLFVSTSNANTGGSGTVTPDANYNDGTHTTIPSNLYYGMDTTSGGNNVTTTFGDQIESCTGAISLINNQLVFGATASNTTPAGVYTANLALIATGTF